MKIQMTDYIITKLESQDYYNGFLELLEQLTVVGADKITYHDFLYQLNHMDGKEVFVIRSNGKVIATAAVYIEKKFTHYLSSVAHIEDIVIDKNYRCKGLGKLMIEFCKEHAKKNSCYKVILSTDEKHTEFYEKCGFQNKNQEMSIYF